MRTPSSFVSEAFDFAFDDASIVGLKRVHRIAEVRARQRVRSKFTVQTLLYFLHSRLEFRGIGPILRAGDMDLKDHRSNDRSGKVRLQKAHRRRDLVEITFDRTEFLDPDLHFDKSKRKSIRHR